MSDKTPIELAGDAVGGLARLASILGVEVQVVSNWKARDLIPIERCVAIERATGGVVTRRDLRPKDWRNIWPELDGPLPKTQQKARV